MSGTRSLILVCTSLTLLRRVSCISARSFTAVLGGCMFVPMQKKLRQAALSAWVGSRSLPVVSPFWLEDVSECGDPQPPMEVPGSEIPTASAPSKWEETCHCPALSSGAVAPLTGAQAKRSPECIRSGQHVGYGSFGCPATVDAPAPPPNIARHPYKKDPKREPTLENYLHRKRAQSPYSSYSGSYILEPLY